MYSIERTAFCWIERHFSLLYLAVITFLALAIRLAGFPFLSLAMNNFLIPWFGIIQKSGLHERVGDYKLLYQTIIYVMTFISLPAIWQYKPAASFL